MRNISRFEYGRSVGWWLQVERSGKTVRRLFSDRQHGGKAKALKAAKQFRDSLNMPPPKRREPSTGTLKRTWRWVERRDGYQYHTHCWSAWITLAPGKLAATHWSIDKWGDAEAKKRASQWLQKKRKEQKEHYSKRKKQQ